MDDYTDSLQIPLNITFAIGSIAKLFVINSDCTGWIDVIEKIVSKVLSFW